MVNWLLGIAVPGFKWLLLLIKLPYLTIRINISFFMSTVFLTKKYVFLATNDQIKELNLPSVVDVLTNYLMHNSIQTKVAVLRWIHDLYIKLPNQVSQILV